MTAVTADGDVGHIPLYHRAFIIRPRPAKHLDSLCFVVRSIEGMANGVGVDTRRFERRAYLSWAVDPHLCLGAVRDCDACGFMLIPGFGYHPS